MGRAVKNSPAAGRTVFAALLLALVALPLQHQADGLSFPAVVSIAQVKTITVPPPQIGFVGILSVAELRDRTPKIDLSLLRRDFKQNLLVWPNVAGDLTRSPPFPARV